MSNKLSGIQKCPTGIHGFDSIITGGGIPRGRPTLITGGAGSGKTLFGIEFLVHGIQQFDEPGVFVSFEERVIDLKQNVTSLGFDLATLINEKKLAIDHVQIDREDVIETGDFDLEGLFIRLRAAIDSVGAKRIVLDTVETLFVALGDTQIIRSELNRLFRWLKESGITAIITAEKGNNGTALTRHGLEEYVSDCVISLDNRVDDQVATRRLRVVKYRGSAHGTNEYPFLIDENGITVLPITSINLDYEVSEEVISTGIAKLDNMFGGHGYFRGGSLLLSGIAGTGKTCIAAHFIDAACRRGEECIYFSFEESPHQIERNMRSIGLDLRKWGEQGFLHFSNFRPATFGLEAHLSMMVKKIDEIKPKAVVIDPVSSFMASGSPLDAKLMLMRLIDLLKSRQITALMTSLTDPRNPDEQSEVGISSIIDSWIMLRNMERGGERTRMLSVIKSRGMRHSNQVRELIINEHGADLIEVFVGPEGSILTGSARVAQENIDRSTAMALEHEIARKENIILNKRKMSEMRIAEMQAAIEAEVAEINASVNEMKSVAFNHSAARTSQALERDQSGVYKHGANDDADRKCATKRV